MISKYTTRNVHKVVTLILYNLRSTIHVQIIFQISRGNLRSRKPNKALTKQANITGVQYLRGYHQVVSTLSFIPYPLLILRGSFSDAHDPDPPLIFGRLLRGRFRRRRRRIRGLLVSLTKALLLSSLIYHPPSTFNSDDGDVVSPPPYPAAVPCVVSSPVSSLVRFRNGNGLLSSPSPLPRL